MTPRERVITALEHKEADRVPVDLGAMLSTGIMGITYNKLKNYLGINSGRTHMYDLGQQLAEPEIEILENIQDDTINKLFLTRRGSRNIDCLKIQDKTSRIPSGFLWRMIWQKI